jgi:hypothetical protein
MRYIPNNEPIVITIKLSPIVSMKKKRNEEEEKIDRIRSCYLWYHTHTGEATTTRKPSKQ